MKLLSDPTIVKMLRRFKAAHTLFLQGDEANTLFLILEGQIELSKNKKGPCALLGPGEVMGEKILISKKPFKRAFTATAKSDVLAVEFGNQEINLIQDKVPSFLLTILRIVIQRLQTVNQLNELLHIEDPAVRFDSWLHTAFENYDPLKGLLIDREDLAYRLAISYSDIGVYLSERVKNGVLQVRESRYFLLDDKKLVL